MPINPLEIAKRQAIYQGARGGAKSLRETRWVPEDDEPQTLGDTLKNAKGLQMSLSATLGIRSVMSAFEKDLKAVVRSVKNIKGGGPLSWAAKYASSALLISQSAQASTYPIVDKTFGTGVTPHVTTGPVTVGAVSLLMPSALIGLGVSAASPGAGKPITKLNTDAMNLLRKFLNRDNAAYKSEKYASGYKPPYTGPAMRPEHGPPDNAAHAYAYRTLRDIEKTIDRIYDTGTPEGGYMARTLKAIFTSNPKQLMRDEREEWVASGQAHVMALSGMHISWFTSYLRGVYRALKATSMYTTKKAKEGFEGVHNVVARPRQQDIQRQQQDFKDLEQILGADHGLKMPHQNPRTITEFLQNQQYIYSVDPYVDQSYADKENMRQMLSRLVNRVSQNQPSVQQPEIPYLYRQPAEHVRPIRAPWDNLYHTGVIQDEFDLRSHLLALKYDKRRGRAKDIIKHMVENIPQGLRDKASEFDMIIPVPMARGRRRERGFNQAEVLAKGVAKHLGIPMETSLLEKIGETSQQSKVARVDRHANIESHYRIRDPHKLYGKNVLLFDDMITTGRTMGVLAEMIRKSGAKSLDAMVMAISDRDFSKTNPQNQRDKMEGLLGISHLSGSRYQYQPPPPSAGRGSGFLRMAHPQAQLLSGRRRQPPRNYPMTLYHATARRNLPNIMKQGISPQFSQGKEPRVWFHTKSLRDWALKHTSRKHNVPIDDKHMVVLKATLPRRDMRRFRKGFWSTPQNITDFEVLDNIRLLSGQRGQLNFADLAQQDVGTFQQWDRQPNVFYAPLRDRQVMQYGGLDRDTRNYHYLIDRIMGARSQEEVVNILVPSGRTFDRSGIRFDRGGHAAVNTAAQLLGMEGLGSRATVFEGRHISDTMSRQGSVVIPQNIITTGTLGELGMRGITPETWQPRSGYAGGGVNIPMPGATASHTYEEVLKHIFSLPLSRNAQQPMLFDRQELRRRDVDTPDTHRAQQIKLLSGQRVPLYEDDYGVRIGSPEGMYAAEHITGSEEVFETIQGATEIFSRDALVQAGKSVYEGLMLPTDNIVGDNKLTYFSYGSEYRVDDSFGFAFDPRTLVKDYGARASKEDLLFKYYDELYDIVGDKKRMHAPPYWVDRVKSDREMSREFLSRVQPLQQRLRLAGVHALDLLRDADLTDLSVQDTKPEITVSRPIRTTDAIGTFRYGEFSPAPGFRLLSGQRNPFKAPYAEHVVSNQGIYNKIRESGAILPRTMQDVSTGGRFPSMGELILRGMGKDIGLGSMYPIDTLAGDADNIFLSYGKFMRKPGAYGFAFDPHEIVGDFGAGYGTDLYTSFISQIPKTLEQMLRKGEMTEEELKILAPRGLYDDQTVGVGLYSLPPERQAAILARTQATGAKIMERRRMYGSDALYKLDSPSGRPSVEFTVNQPIPIDRAVKLIEDGKLVENPLRPTPRRRRTTGANLDLERPDLVRAFAAFKFRHPGRTDVAREYQESGMSGFYDETGYNRSAFREFRKYARPGFHTRVQQWQVDEYLNINLQGAVKTPEEHNILQRDLDKVFAMGDKTLHDYFASILKPETKLLSGSIYGDVDLSTPAYDLPVMTPEQYLELESGDRNIFWRRQTGSDTVSQRLGRFIGRDDNMTTLIRQLTKGISKDVFGARHVSRDMQGLALEYAKEWFPQVFGTFQRIIDPDELGDVMYYRSGMFAFPNLQSLADYDYASSGKILAMEGDLSASYFQGNMYPDLLAKHPYESMVDNIKVIGQWRPTLSKKVFETRSEREKQLYHAYTAWQNAKTQEDSFRAQKDLALAMGAPEGTLDNILQVPGARMIRDQVGDMGGETLFMGMLEQALTEAFPRGFPRTFDRSTTDYTNDIFKLPEYPTPTLQMLQDVADELNTSVAQIYDNVENFLMVRDPARDMSDMESLFTPETQDYIFSKIAAGAQSGLDFDDFANETTQLLSGQRFQTQTPRGPVDTLNPETAAKHLKMALDTQLAIAINLTEGDQKRQAERLAADRVAMLDEQVDVLRQIDNSVAVVEMLDEDMKSLGYGTGFSLREGELLTNAHVVLGSRKRSKPARFAEAFVLGSQEQRFPLGEVLDIVPDADMAALAIPSGVGQINQLQLADMFDPEGAERILSLGVSARRTGPGIKQNYMLGQVSGRNYQEGGIGLRAFGMTAPVQPGMSGGPVLNELLQVIGMNVTKSADPYMPGIAIGRDEIAHFLKLMDSRRGTMPPRSLADLEHLTPNFRDRIYGSSYRRSSDTQLLSGQRRPTTIRADEIGNIARRQQHFGNEEFANALMRQYESMRTIGDAVQSVRRQERGYIDYKTGELHPHTQWRYAKKPDASGVFVGQNQFLTSLRATVGALSGHATTPEERIEIGRMGSASAPPADIKGVLGLDTEADLLLLETEPGAHSKYLPVSPYKSDPGQRVLEYGATGRIADMLEHRGLYRPGVITDEMPLTATGDYAPFHYFVQATDPLASYMSTTGSLGTPIINPDHSLAGLVVGQYRDVNVDPSFAEPGSRVAQTYDIADEIAQQEPRTHFASYEEMLEHMDNLERKLYRGEDPRIPNLVRAIVVDSDYIYDFIEDSLEVRKRLDARGKTMPSFQDFQKFVTGSVIKEFTDTYMDQYWGAEAEARNNLELKLIQTQYSDHVSAGEQVIPSAIENVIKESRVDILGQIPGFGDMTPTGLTRRLTEADMIQLATEPTPGITPDQRREALSGSRMFREFGDLEKVQKLVESLKTGDDLADSQIIQAYADFIVATQFVRDDPQIDKIQEIGRKTILRNRQFNQAGVSEAGRKLFERNREDISGMIELGIARQREGRTHLLSGQRRPYPYKVFMAGSPGGMRSPAPAQRFMDASIRDVAGMTELVGSGFFGGEGQLITNRHVLDVLNVKSPLMGYGAVRGFAQGPEGDIHELQRVLHADANADIAILGAQPDSRQRIYPMAEQLLALQQGDRFNMETAQLTVGELEYLRGMSNAELAQIAHGYVRGASQYEPYWLYQHIGGQRPVPGTSGSPLVSEQGRAIGVASGGTVGGDEFFGFPIASPGTYMQRAGIQDVSLNEYYRELGHPTTQLLSGQRVRRSASEPFKRSPQPFGIHYAHLGRAYDTDDYLESFQRGDYISDFTEPRWTGTGFFIEPGKLLTNSHVLRSPSKMWDHETARSVRGIVRGLRHDIGDFAIQNVLLEDVERDFALLQVEPHKRQIPYELVGQEPKFGKELTIAGSFIPAEKRGRGHFDPEMQATLGYYSKITPFLEEYGDTLHHNPRKLAELLDTQTLVMGRQKSGHDSTFKGMSGSPILQSSRKAVGILFAAMGQYDVGTSAEALIEALEEYDGTVGPTLDEYFGKTKLLSGQRDKPLTFEGYDVDDIEVMLEDWRGGESLIKEQIEAIEKYYQHIGQAMPPVREPYGAATTAQRTRDYGTPGKDLEDMFKNRRRTPAATDFENYSESEIDEIISLMERGAEITAEQHAVVVAYNQQANERSAKVAGETAARTVETVVDAAEKATQQQQPRRQYTDSEIESEIDRLNYEMDMAEGETYVEDDRTAAAVDQRNIDMATAAAESDIENTIDTTYNPEIFTQQPDIDDTERTATTTMDYTENQLKAIKHGEGRGLVIAGPGAGKTAVLRGRVEDLVGRGINLRNILTLAYNTEAKDELIKRLRHLGDAQVQTLHGFAYRIVRENLSEAGFEYTPKVPQKKKGETLERFIATMLQLENEGRAVDPRTVKEVAGEIDVLRSGITEGRFDPDMLQGEARTMATAYEVFKKDHNIIDFHDMLEIAGDVLESYPNIRARYQRQYPFLQVDEFQDVSPADMRILSQLTSNFFAVGDDDQSIYRFRGADATPMHRFRQGADEYEVTANFRSRPEIVEAANRIVEGSQRRIPKQLVSTRDPGGSVRYVESNPYDVFKKLQAELKQGQETALLVRTQHEERELMKFLLEMPELAEDVTVSTMHSAKGLEFDKVIVLLNTLERSGGLYRSFPTANTPEELEEERRLFYVATTRAKEELVYMGREEKFLRELGFEPESQRTPPPQETARTVKDMEVQSKGIADFFGNLFHRFRAHYQRVRTYQDMVEMERDLPLMNIVENIDVAQLNRSKIEDMGRQIGIEPAARSERPAKMRMLDRILGSLHKPGRIYGGSMAGVLTAGELFPPTNPFASFGLYTLPLGLAKVARKIDESLYPYARRPESMLDYRQLFIEMPDRVRENLPDEVVQSALDEHGELRNWRFVQSRSEGTYQPVFYEFPDPVAGWEGESIDRPLFDMWGRQMNRMPQEELEALDAQGLRSVTDTSLDTSDPSKNLQIRPYSEFGYEDIYEPPTRPRAEGELSEAVKEFIVNLRGYVAQNQIGARRPRWRDDIYFRWKWGRNHRQALRKIDKFLIKNLNNDVINFQHAARVLDRMHRSRSPISMGAEAGVHDVGSAVNAMHNEVLDHLEKVWNERSPYYSPSHWIMAGGKFHKLPDGTMADVEQEPVTHTPKPRTRDRLKDMFGGTTRKPKGLERYGLMIETFDELGESINIGSGAYLGDGRVGTALHTFQGSGTQMPTRAVARTLTGDQDIDITGFLNYDPDLDLAILQLDETSAELKNLRAAKFGRGLGAGRKVQTMGVAHLGKQGIQYPYRSKTTISEASDTMGMLGAQTPFFPMQSGSGVFRRRLFGLLPPRLQGVFTGAGLVDEYSPERGFYAPVQQLQALMESGNFTAFDDAIGEVSKFGERSLLERTNQRLREIGKDPHELRGERQRSARILLQQQKTGYLREIAELEQLMSDLEGKPLTQTPDQLLGFDQTTGMPLAPDEIASARGTVEGQHLGALIETVREVHRPELERIDNVLSILNDPANTRAADFGRSLRGTRYEGVARVGADIVGAGADRLTRGLGHLSQFGRGVRGIRGVGVTMKALGAVGGPALEVLDALDKIEYWGGSADQRITGTAIESADSTRMFERYSAILQEGQIRDKGSLNLLQEYIPFLGYTPLEREYLDHEGGLKPALDMEIAGGKPFRWLGRQPGFKQLGEFKSVQAIGELAHTLVTGMDIVEKTIPSRIIDAVSGTSGYDVRREYGEELSALTTAIDPTQLSPENQQKYQETLEYERQMLEQDLAEAGKRLQKAQTFGEDFTFRKAIAPVAESFAGRFGFWGLGDVIKAGDPARIENLQKHKESLQQRQKALDKGVVTTGLKTALPPIPAHLRTGLQPVVPPTPITTTTPPIVAVPEVPITASLAPLAQSEQLALRPEVALMSDPQAQVLGANILMATPAEADMSEMFFDASDTQRQQVVGDIQQQPKGLGLHFAQPTEGQPYLIIEGPEAVIDGDTIKGILHAFGEESLVKVRFPSIDTAETDPGFMDRRFGRQTERSRESIAREKRIAREQKKNLQTIITDAIAGSKRLNIPTETGMVVIPGYEDQIIGKEVSESLLKRATYEQGYIVPLHKSYIGQEGAMGRPLAELELTHTETGAKMTYSEIALQQGMAARFGHDMSWGAPMHPHLMQFSADEREAAAKFYEKYREDTRLTESQQHVIDLQSEIETFTDTYKRKTDKMYGSYTAEDLRGYISDLAGTEDAPGRIVGMRESIAGKEMLLQRMKDTFDSLIPDEGDFKMIHDYEGKQEAIEDLEKEIKAEKGALEDLMGVLRDSHGKLNQLRTSVHKARMSQLKEERQLAVQNAQEEYQTLAESVVEHEEVRKLLPESMLSNRDFMQKYESSFKERMLGEESDTQLSLQALKDQMESKNVELKKAAERKDTAFKAFEAAPGTETESEYTKATQEYATTYAEYTQLQRLKALEEKTLEAVEKGLDASQRATAVAESVADALEAKEIGKTLRADTQGLGDIFKGIESARSDELGGRLERLYEQPTWYNAFGRQRLMDDARTWGATSVEALQGQESLYQTRIGELQPTLTAEQAELADLEARHKTLLAAGVDMETGKVLDEKKMEEASLVEQQIEAKEQHIKGIEETIRKYEEHIERIKEGIDEIAEKLARYMELSVRAAGAVTEERMREETATKKRLGGKAWEDYTEEDTQKFQELMQTPEMYWDESDYAFKRSFLAARRRDFDKAGKEKELEFFRTGTPEEIREYELKRRAGQTQDPIARKNAINRAYDEYERYQRKEQEMQAKIEFQNRARIAGGIGNLMGDLPGDMVEGWVLRPRQIDQRYKEKAEELLQDKRDRVAEIRDNPLISKRQQDAQIERLDERHQERMKKLQEDTDKAKMESYNSVVSNFAKGVGKMITEEAQLRLARGTTGKIFDMFGWNEGGSGEAGALRATSTKSGVTLSDFLRHYFSDGGDTGGGGIPPGTMGAGGSSRSGGGGFSFNPSFKGIGRPSLPKVSGQGNNWLARALPKDKGGGGFLKGVADWWDSGYSQMASNVAATQAFEWQGLGSLLSGSGAGSLSAGLSTVASPFVLMTAATMGMEALTHSADVLNRTSGTGNWFTQSGKDIAGFLGDTFSFDNALNDRMARKVGAMQQVQASKRKAREMGHSSAMDLLGEHAQGFQEEVDNMHKRQGASMGMGDDKTLVANIQIVQEDGGRQRVKKDELKRVKLTRQNVLPSIQRR